MAERALTGHAEIFGLLSFMSTLWARRSLAFLLLEHFASSVIVTEARLKNSSSLTACPNDIHKQTRLMKILTLHRRQECWPRRLQDKPEIGAKVIKVECLIVKNIQNNTGDETDVHLYVSDSRIWQLAWCSNWSSSHKKLWQKEQRKMRPPVHYTTNRIWLVSPTIAEHGWFTVR